MQTARPEGAHHQCGPTSVQVEQGPNLLRSAAEAAAKQWRFTPAQVNGQAVPATFLLTLKFRLQ